MQGLLVLFPISAICALLYRFGGLGLDGVRLYPKLAWAMKRGTRRFGCTLIVLATVFWLGVQAEWYAWALTALLSYGAICTYWDRVYKNYDNFYLHGFMLGLAFFPLALWGDLSWGLMFLRAGVTGLLMGGLCAMTGNDWVEELGRGYILNATTLLYLL